MNFIATALLDAFILEPKVFGDARGYFMEAFKLKEFQEQVCNTVFIQDNESKSKYGVLRGLHFQKTPYAQAKLVRVLQGNVLDVAVDLRRNSSTFGKHVVVELSEENKRQFFVPKGFAHGFLVLSDTAVVSYKIDAPYMPEYEAGIRYNCSELAIDWQISEEHFILSDKDKVLPCLKDAALFE